MACDPAGEELSFDALPEEALRVIFVALPVDARARAACVCRSWRAFLADVSLWLKLDLTAETGGVDAVRLEPTLTSGALARAGGKLRELSILSGAGHVAFLCAAIEGNCASLRRVNTDVHLEVEELGRVRAVAPRLEGLNVRGTCRLLLPLLRREPPYEELLLNGLEVRMIGNGGTVEDGEGQGGAGEDDDLSDVDVLDLAAAVKKHETVTRLRILEARSSHWTHLLLDAVAGLRLTVLDTQWCSWDDDAFDSLVRVCEKGALATLKILSCEPFSMYDVPKLCRALRTCSALQQLRFCVDHPWVEIPCDTVSNLLRAARSMRALKVLDLSSCNLGWSRQAALTNGDELGAFLGANLWRLHTLKVEDCSLGDAGVELMLDGLAHNTHLRALYCGHNNMSAEFEGRVDALLALTARNGGAPGD